MTTAPKPKILTNMAFWQSDVWQAATDSIYDPLSQHDPSFKSPLWEAWQLWRNAGQYDVVVTMGVRTSMVYAALCWMTFRPSKQMTTELFIDTPSQAGGLWKIKTWFYSTCANRAMGHLTNSRPEIESMAARYSISPNLFRYVPLHTTIKEPRHIEPDQEKYILSAGRSGRDYSTLVEALRPIHLPTRIIGDAAKPDWPDHITGNHNVPRDTYLEELKNAWIVAVPLLDVPRATGQVVILEAMALGKPVIATRTTGSVDIIENERNGLLVQPGDVEGWQQAVMRLKENPAWGKELAQNALQDVIENHSIEKHAGSKLQAIQELFQRSS